MIMLMTLHIIILAFWITTYAYKARFFWDIVTIIVSIVIFSTLAELVRLSMIMLMTLHIIILAFWITTYAYKARCSWEIFSILA